MQAEYDHKEMKYCYLTEFSPLILRNLVSWLWTFHSSRMRKIISFTHNLKTPCRANHSIFQRAEHQRLNRNSEYACRGTLISSVDRELIKNRNAKCVEKSYTTK